MNKNYKHTDHRAGNQEGVHFLILLFSLVAGFGVATAGMGAERVISTTNFIIETAGHL